MNRYTMTLRIAGWVVLFATFATITVGMRIAQIMNPDQCPVGLTCTTPSLKGVAVR